jgi:hypothetical protein
MTGATHKQPGRALHNAHFGSIHIEPTTARQDKNTTQHNTHRPNYLKDEGGHALLARADGEEARHLGVLHETEPADEADVVVLLSVFGGGDGGGVVVGGENKEGGQRLETDG